jgi:hypothetical protein
MITTKERYCREIEEVITKAKATRSRESLTTRDGAEIYAYPKPEGNIAWGINSAGTGVNLWSGIRRPDGSDIMEG